MAILKRKLFFSFLILLGVGISAELTGWGVVLLDFILHKYNTVAKLYALFVIIMGGYYFYVHKNKETSSSLGTILLDCATIIATFYTGISYFSSILENISGLFSLLSEEYLPFIMANTVLLYWSLNQSINRFRNTFYEKESTTEVKESPISL